MAPPPEQVSLEEEPVADVAVLPQEKMAVDLETGEQTGDDGALKPLAPPKDFGELLSPHFNLCHCLTATTFSGATCTHIL